MRMSFISAIANCRTAVWLAPMLLAVNPVTSRALPVSNSAPVFVVRDYQIAGQKPFDRDSLVHVLSPYTGTNIGFDGLAKAAAAVQREYARHGYTNMTVA